jgi:Holliday junction resolvasome RuvABC endonuclease subunit
MKKYITLFSLITLFFVGIQQNQAQELERKSLDESQGKAKQAQMNELANKEKEQSPKHKAKVAGLELEEANMKSKQQLAEFNEAAMLTSDQKTALNKVFAESNKKLIVIGSDDSSKKAVETRAAIKEDTNLMIKKILNEDQMVLYNEYLEKKDK